MAVGTQRDHLLGVVRAAFREILDMVNFQDRVTGIGHVLRLTRAAWTLAVPLAAQQHGTARRLQAQHVDAHMRAAKPGAAIASTDPIPHRRRYSSSSGLLTTITSPGETTSSAMPAAASPASARIAS